MVMHRFSPRSLRNLQGVHPDLARLAFRALELSEVAFEVTEGLRSLERQKKLFEDGLSMTMQSKHLMQPDGFAHAIDVMATGDLDHDGDTDKADAGQAWSWTHYVTISKAFERASEELGLKSSWGGHWAKLRDGVHFELGNVSRPQR